MSKIINAVLSKFSAKYKSIDELSKLYLAQLQTKDYAAKAIQNKTCYVNHACRQPATGGGGGEHVAAAVRTFTVKQKRP